MRPYHKVYRIIDPYFVRRYRSLLIDDIEFSGSTIKDYHLFVKLLFFLALGPYPFEQIENDTIGLI